MQAYAQQAASTGSRGHPLALVLALFTALVLALVLIAHPLRAADESAAPEKGQTAAPGERTVRSGGLPPQGVFESASLNSDWKPRLAQIADAGFSLVLNYNVLPPPSNVSKAQLLEYAREAEARDLKIVWSLKDPEWWNGSDLTKMFPRLAEELDATDSDVFLAKFIGMLKSQPSTWGYYVVDEAERSMAPDVIRFAQKIRAEDPSHSTLTVHFGLQFKKGHMQPFEPAATYIGFDEYPIGQYASDEAMWKAMNTLYTNVLTWVKSTGKPFIPVLQANDVVEAYPRLIKDWQWHQWPSVEQMKKQRDLVLRIAREHNVRVPAIFWYSYYDILEHRPEQLDRVKSAAFAPPE